MFIMDGEMECENMFGSTNILENPLSWRTNLSPEQIRFVCFILLLIGISGRERENTRMFIMDGEIECENQ